MFNQMRRQLTLTCAVATATVLIVMALFSLQFSLQQHRRQAEARFLSNINTVLFYLESQNVIDQTWLKQTETDNQMWIRIESRHSQLQYTEQTPARAQLTRQALTQAEAQYGIDPFFAAGGLDPLVFALSTDQGNFYASVTSLAYQGDRLSVTILKDQSPDLAVARQLKAAFFCSVLAAIFALLAFSWYFSGRIIRPVAESHERQVEFVSAASHELRAPLAVISLSAQTLKKLALSTPARPEHENTPDLASDLANKIERETARLNKLVADLLQLARAEHKSDPAIWPAVSVRTLLLNTQERFEVAAAQASITLVVKQSEDNRLSLPCDQRLVEQALAIYVENALRFTPAGGQVQLSAKRIRPNIRFGSRSVIRRQMLVLSVSDSGPGIADGDKPKVFERFFQGDPARHDREHYGLGLAIAKQIAQHHGGTVSVEDSALGGAQFNLWLPL